MTLASGFTRFLHVLYVLTVDSQCECSVIYYTSAIWGVV